MRVSFSLLTELALLGDQEADETLDFWRGEETSTLGNIEAHFYADANVPYGYFYIHIPVPQKRTVTMQGVSDSHEDE